MKHAPTTCRGVVVSATQTLQICCSLNRLAGVGAPRIPALTCGARNAHQAESMGTKMIGFGMHGMSVSGNEPPLQHGGKSIRVEVMEETMEHRAQEELDSNLGSTFKNHHTKFLPTPVAKSVEHDGNTCQLTGCKKLQLISILAA